MLDGWLVDEVIRQINSKSPKFQSSKPKEGREKYSQKRKKILEENASWKYRDVSGLSLVMWNYLHFSFRLDLMKNITLEKVLCIFKFGGAST